MGGNKGKMKRKTEFRARADRPAEIYDFLIEVMMSSGVSVTQLAAELHTSQANASNLINRTKRGQLPRLQTINKILAVCGYEAIIDVRPVSRPAEPV